MQLNEDLTFAVTGKNVASLSFPANGYFQTLYLNGNQLAGNGAYSVVTFSANPIFSVNGNDARFKLTLTGNVASSTLSGAAAGNIITFIIVQDGTGGRSFTWPGTVLGAIPVGLAAGQVTVQSLIFDGTNAYPIAPGAMYP